MLFSNGNRLHDRIYRRGDSWNPHNTKNRAKKDGKFIKKNLRKVPKGYISFRDLIYISKKKYAKFDIVVKICYNKIVALKKGGIIIEYESKKMLLKKELILIPMAILSIALASNAVEASNITETKERIKEIKIVEEQNIEKLKRNKKVTITTSYTRSIAQVSSRGEETSRKTKNTEKKTKSKNKEHK